MMKETDSRPGTFQDSRRQESTKKSLQMNWKK